MLRDSILNIFHCDIEYVITSHSSTAEHLNLLHIRSICMRAHGIVTFNIVNAQLLDGYSSVFSIYILHLHRKL